MARTYYFAGQHDLAIEHYDKALELEDKKREQLAVLLIESLGFMTLTPGLRIL